MAVFSTNQVRQLYVVNALKDVLVESDAAGTLGKPQVSTVDKSAFFKYKGVDTVMCSDFTPKSNILGASVTPASKLLKKLAVYNFTTTTNTLAAAVGQEAIVRITFRDYIGISPEYQMQRYGSAYITNGITLSKFYLELALSLALAGVSPINQYFDVYLKTSNSTVRVLPTSKASDFTGTYTGVNIVEAPQDWILGVKPQVTLNFVPQIVPVTINNISEPWGTVASLAPVDSPNSNGIAVADLEYFCMGERGDIYRNVGFPNVLHTKYLVDPSKSYNMIDIEFYYAGEGNAVQHSNKLVSLAILAEGADLAAKNALTNSIITEINTAYGTSLAALPVA